MKNIKRPSIDIILCCYNQEQYIGQALDSILNQKIDADIRVIIADDHSTDKTLNIIRDTEKRSVFPFVYLESPHNLGHQANYKRAFRACSADYIAILEGDDWWSENWHLSQHVKFLRSHPWFSMSFNQITTYFQNLGQYHVMTWPFGKTSHIKVKLKHQISWGNQIGNLSSCVFRTKYIHALPDEFYSLNFADWELGIMMALEGPIGLLKGSSSTYRINDKGQWTSLSSSRKRESESATLENISPLLPKKCEKYIKYYKKMSQTSMAMPFPMPLKYRIKSILKKIK